MHITFVHWFFPLQNESHCCIVCFLLCYEQDILIQLMIQLWWWFQHIMWNLLVVMIILVLEEGSYSRGVEIWSQSGRTTLSCSGCVGFMGLKLNPVRDFLHCMIFFCEVPVINYTDKHYCNSTYKKACPFKDRPIQEGNKKEQNGDSTHQKHTSATWFLLKHFCNSFRFIKQQIWRKLTSWGTISFISFLAKSTCYWTVFFSFFSFFFSFSHLLLYSYLIFENDPMIAVGSIWCRLNILMIMVIGCGADFNKDNIDVNWLLN